MRRQKSKGDNLGLWLMARSFPEKKKKKKAFQAETSVTTQIKLQRCRLRKKWVLVFRGKTDRT